MQAEDKAVRADGATGLSVEEEMLIESKFEEAEEVAETRVYLAPSRPGCEGGGEEENRTSYSEYWWYQPWKRKNRGNPNV